MNTKALRQKILDLAIHGKLVPQDPNDEPASVLLERIRDEKERLIKEGKIKRPKKTKTTSDKPHYPYELPEGWVWTTLGEITNYGDSVNVQVGDIDNTDWVLELEDIEKDSANIIQHLTKNDRKINGTRHKFQKGEILYSKLRTYLNKVLVAPNDGFCTTEIMAFGSYGILSNEYICHALRSPYFLAYTLQCGYGVKMPRLSTTDACNGLIPLPPLEEQERIVIEIQRLFSIIDIVEGGKDDLKVAIQAAKSKILDLAIHGKLVPQDPNDKPASELLKRINPKAEITCDNGHYQKLPEGWAVCCLENVAKVLDNLRKPINSNERNSRIANKHENELFPYYGATGQVGFIDDYLVDGTFLLLGEDGAPFLDKYAIKSYPIKGKCWVNNHAHILEPQCDFDYLMYYLNHVDYKDYVNGSTRLKLTQSDMRSIIILLPPLTEQKRISVKVKYLFRLLDSIACNL